MIRQELTKAQEQRLRDQVIADDQPGPVLHDFRVILDFLGPEGVEAAGKHNLLPIKRIGELDSRLSRPLHLELKRPQLRSHPYLQGLNLLLRASGLTRVEGTGNKTRLVLDPEMMMQWDQLNPTERYFNLLEAWLRFGRAEMVGERSGIWEGMLMNCLQAWQSVPAEGSRLDLKYPQFVSVAGISRDFYQLALMDLFGLIAVEHPLRPVAPWCPAGLRHVPFGDAALSLLGSHFFADKNPYTVLALDREESSLEAPRFGLWQPLFQPFFPEWKNNLELRTSELRKGTYVFRVSLGKIWQLIAIPADETLEDLVQWILTSVNFDDDHLYQFDYRNRLGAMESAYHPYMDEGPSTEEVPIGSLPLEPGQTMDLTYDFGDNWQFKIKLERIEPPGGKKQKARILEKHGKSPEQYPGADW